MPIQAGKCCAPTAPTCVPAFKPLFKQNVETKPTEMQPSFVGKDGWRDFTKNIKDLHYNKPLLLETHIKEVSWFLALRSGVAVVKAC